MPIQIFPNCRTLAIRLWVLAAIGISVVVLPATTFSADLRAADPGAVATALQSLPAERQPIPARRTDPLATSLESSSATVDQLYKELMEWTSPWCRSPTSDPSLRYHC
jgi:hypothetical protein